ncbi:hypothetical protein F2P45_05505 [Massilia sp. CCM 8733]|uniref:Uncharacterized protein n=1 Tax=Massilia mucilaginosa TaxID=2609282 RepID=A0ABX0NP18_9BURK|nr:hypothetical protein [Massilia mucilaginosa]NHZ88482.1 hypothetical protein [Massilia mucilaginosa]
MSDEGVAWDEPEFLSLSNFSCSPLNYLAGGNRRFFQFRMKIKQMGNVNFEFGFNNGGINGDKSNAANNAGKLHNLDR